MGDLSLRLSEARWWEANHGELVVLRGAAAMMEFDEWVTAQHNLLGFVDARELEYYEPRSMRCGYWRGGRVTFVGVPDDESDETRAFLASLRRCEVHGWSPGLTQCARCLAEG